MRQQRRGAGCLAGVVKPVIVRKHEEDMGMRRCGGRRDAGGSEQQGHRAIMRRRARPGSKKAGACASLTRTFVGLDADMRPAYCTGCKWERGAQRKDYDAVHKRNELARSLRSPFRLQHAMVYGCRSGATSSDAVHFNIRTPAPQFPRKRSK